MGIFAIVGFLFKLLFAVIIFILILGAIGLFFKFVGWIIEELGNL